LGKWESTLFQFIRPLENPETGDREQQGGYHEEGVIWAVDAQSVILCLIKN